MADIGQGYFRLAKPVDIHTFKLKFSRLLREVEAGEEIVITRCGKPVARLVGFGPRSKVTARSRVAGFLKGKIWIGPDFDDPLPEDLLAAFRGEGD